MIVIQWVMMPTVTISTISNGDTGSFTFSGNNGIGVQTITTTTNGVPVSGATTTLTTASVSTTITETIPANYKLMSIDCTGLGTSGTATNDLANGTVTLDAAATASGADINCTFTNQKWANLTLAKTWNNGIINDAVTISSSGFSNNATVSSTSTRNNTTTGTSIEVTPGETGTITESFDTGSAANYNSVLSCSGNSIPLSGNQLTISSTDTNVLCTETNTLLPATISVSKSANPVSNTAIVGGASIDYTIQAVISRAASTSDLVLTDTLSNNQTLGSLPSGCTASGQIITCTVPANSTPGTYIFTYPATVNQNASGSVSNEVTPSSSDSFTCTNCSTMHPISTSVITVSKYSVPASGTAVTVGENITYTLQAVIGTSSNTTDLVLTDTLSNNQTLGALPSGCTASGQIITCTVPANSTPGTYIFTYPATVNQNASGSVSNNVTPSGGGSSNCVNCSTTHPLRPENDNDLTLNITSDSKNFSLPGITIIYNYRVTNNGSSVLYIMSISLTSITGQLIVLKQQYLPGSP